MLNLNEKENKIYGFLKSINEERGIYTNYNQIFRGGDGSLVPHCYGQDMILGSLYDLGEKSSDKPTIMCYPGHEFNLSKILKKINEVMKKRGQLDRSVIYIHNDRAHITVFYLFQKRKKILHIDSASPGRRPILGDENYTLYSSDIKIQEDGYSCGPIASEIARMLYSNYKKVECGLSKQDSYNVKLDSLLPKEELNQLCKSFSEEMTVGYGKDEIKIKGADYRTVHFMCQLTMKGSPIYAEPFLLSTTASDFVRESSQEEKRKAKEIRSFFIGKPDNVKLFFQISNDLTWAVKEGNEHLVNALIKAKANINIRDKDGFSPLHCAIFTHNRSVFKSLIKAKANVNIQDKSGSSPLHWAVLLDCISAVHILIDNGADHMLKNEDGDTPRDLAQGKDDSDDIKNLLEEAERNQVCQKTKGDDVSTLTSGRSTPTSTSGIHHSPSTAIQALRNVREHSQQEQDDGQLAPQLHREEQNKALQVGHDGQHKLQQQDDVSTPISSTTPTSGLYGAFAPNTAGTEVENNNTTPESTVKESNPEAPPQDSTTKATNSGKPATHKNTNTTFWSEHKGKIALGVAGLCIAGAVVAFLLECPIVIVSVLAALAAAILVITGIVKACEGPDTEKSNVSVSNFTSRDDEELAPARNCRQV